MCVHPLGGTAVNGTSAVLFPGCDFPQTNFSFTSSGSIKHNQSGRCLHPKGGVAINDVELVFNDGCDEPRLAFEVTPSGSLKHKESTLCVHNQFSGTGNNTKLVLYTGCDSDQRLQYDIQPTGWSSAAGRYYISGNKGIYISPNLSTITTYIFS